MPSSYINFAVDFTGNGRRDLIHSVPDVLASTAIFFTLMAGSEAADGRQDQPILPSSRNGIRLTGILGQSPISRRSFRKANSEESSSTESNEDSLRAAPRLARLGSRKANKSNS